MPENDNSRFREDDSCRKPTHHIEMVGWQAGFFAQSSVLSTQSLFSCHPTPGTFFIGLTGYTAAISFYSADGWYK
jgi:hypothetical protein